MKKNFLLLSLILIFNAGCKDDDQPVDPIHASLVETLNQELNALSLDPNLWTDDELQTLDGISGRTIVGLGEATHGTSEFFKAKHRILKYLVEKQGFKIFAIEADFGESVIINQAVRNSDKSQIEKLMKETMLFWTWRTNEVRDLIYWMCDYNKGKADIDKVEYWGVDCQYNTYNPDMVKVNLQVAKVSFLAFAESILNEAKASTKNGFSGYTASMYSEYLGKLDALKDSLAKYKEDIIENTSERYFQLNLQLIELTKQASDVAYKKNYRDEYMAKNTAWLHEYFNGAKIVLWAHNFHVCDYRGVTTMGQVLKNEFHDEYAALGFLFSKGSFMAIRQEGQQYYDLRSHTIEEEPRAGSINEVMSHATSPVFMVNTSDLQNHQQWSDALSKGMDYFHIGAVYNGKPGDYYDVLYDDYFDHLIYFNRTTAAVQVQ